MLRQTTSSLTNRPSQTSRTSSSFPTTAPGWRARQTSTSITLGSTWTGPAGPSRRFWAGRTIRSARRKSVAGEGGTGWEDTRQV